MIRWHCARIHCYKWVIVVVPHTDQCVVVVGMRCRRDFARKHSVGGRRAARTAFRYTRRVWGSWARGERCPFRLGFLDW